MPLSKLTDFNCKGAICYGIGPVNHQKFIDFQKRINALSGVIKSRLQEDGFIGDGTVTAILTVAGWVQKNQPNLMSDHWRLVLRSPNKETVATLVPELTGQLNTVAQVLASGGNLPSPLPSPPGSPVPPGAQSMFPAPTQPQVPLVTPQMPPTSTPGFPTTTGLPRPPSAPPATQITFPQAQAALAPQPEEKKPVWPWIVGGVAVVGALGAIAFAVSSRRD